jgi:hypothetical protein
VTLTEAFEYAKERTIRDTLRVASETQHPSYAVNLRGRRDLVLAQVAASPSTLSLSQDEGPLELIHADSGLQLLELPAGPRRVKLAVPPGTYLVRKRLAQGNLVREIVVAPGGRNEISEAQLTLVGHVGLAAKSARDPVAPTLALATPAPAARPASNRRWFGAGALLTAGVAVASFGMAVKFAVDVSDIQEDLDPYRRFNCADGTPSCSDPAGTMHRPPLTAQEESYVQQLQDESKSFERNQWNALAVAGVAAAVSVPLFYYWLRAEPAQEPARQPRLSLAPAVLPGQAGVTALLRF